MVLATGQFGVYSVCPEDFQALRLFTDVSSCIDLLINGIL